MTIKTTGRVYFGENDGKTYVGPLDAGGKGIVVDGVVVFKVAAGGGAVPEVTGDRGDNTALTSLLVVLDGMGLITDSTTT